LSKKLWTGGGNDAVARTHTTNQELGEGGSLHVHREQQQIHLLSSLFRAFRRLASFANSTDPLTTDDRIVG
jgi:hypothetical protein